MRIFMFLCYRILLLLIAPRVCTSLHLGYCQLQLEFVPILDRVIRTSPGCRRSATSIFDFTQQSTQNRTRKEYKRREMIATLALIVAIVTASALAAHAAPRKVRESPSSGYHFVLTSIDHISTVTAI